MRIPAFLGLLVLGVLGGPAYAERYKSSPATSDVAGRADHTRGERVAASLTAGELAITSATPRAHPASHDPTPGISPRSARKPSHLSAGDISSNVALHATEIEHCYLDAVGTVRRTAQLDLMFVIAREGDVLSLDIAAPTASPQAVHRIATCIRTAVDGLRFPERRNDTTAIIPYVFQRTEAPGAGPQLSCWNPKGC